MKTLALFDFDGTLYKKDSLLEFTKFSKGKLNFYIGLFMISQYLIGFKWGIISNEKAKQKFIKHFFKNTNYNDFTRKCNDFALQKINTHLNEKIYEQFINHLKLNHTVYIVTASIPEWIEPWSKQFSVPVIGTQIEIENNKITGGFVSKNCYGIEKVNRINSVLNLNEFESIIVYGAGKGDVEMLKLAK
jgi:phosphatidylglycerophosphatase C